MRWRDRRAKDEGGGDAGTLLCPSCRRAFADSERVCPDCGLPLAHAAALGGGVEAVPVSERRRTARKINPRYTEGELVRAARAPNRPQAEVIQGMLLDAGVPSILRAAPDIPELLATGACEVLVPESGLQTAREVLLQEGGR